MAFTPSWCGVHRRPPTTPPSTTRSWPLMKLDSSEAMFSSQGSIFSTMQRFEKIAQGKFSSEFPIVGKRKFCPLSPRVHGSAPERTRKSGRSPHGFGVAKCRALRRRIKRRAAVSARTARFASACATSRRESGHGKKSAHRLLTLNQSLLDRAGMDRGLKQRWARRWENCRDSLRALGFRQTRRRRRACRFLPARAEQDAARLTSRVESCAAWRHGEKDLSGARAWPPWLPGRRIGRL